MSLYGLDSNDGDEFHGGKGLSRDDGDDDRSRTVSYLARA